jgi:large subunit ribosomal protein L24
MRIKKNDQVLIISGKDRGKKGKVLEAFPADFKVTVEGTNIRKKNTKAKKSGEKGQVVQIPFPVSVSNVSLLCAKCNKPARIGYKIIDQKKYRVCKRCGAEF